MEGSLNQVLPVFKEHEQDRMSIGNDEEQQNFDLDWKESRSRLPEMSYNFKREKDIDMRKFLILS